MKIQIVNYSPADHKSSGKKGAWHRIAIEMEKKGHKIDFITKEKWPTFYLRYLKFRPDIIIITHMIGYFVVKLKKLGLIRCPILFAWQDHYTEVMGRKWGISRIAKIENYIGENADIITTPSTFRTQINKLLGLKTIHIQHGITENIKQIKAKKLSEKRLKFIYLGEISKYKNVDNIINAFKNKKAVLYLLGSLTNKEIIKNLPKNVKFLGFKKHEEAISYVKGCDIAINANDQDTSLKMYEYLACGKPILAPRGRIVYTLTPGKECFICDDFSKGVDYLIKHPKVVNELSKNAKKFKNITWKQNAEQQLAVIYKLLKQNKRKK